MSKRHWFRCFPTNYLDGVRGLGDELVAAYTRIFMEMYALHGPVKLDPQKLKHLLEKRPQDVTRIVGRLVEAGKLSIDEAGFIHNGHTDAELAMNGKWRPDEPGNEHSTDRSHERPDEPEMKLHPPSHNSEKPSKNYARANDRTRDHPQAKKRIEDREIEDKGGPPPSRLGGAALIVDADALPPREDAAVAPLGLEGRALAPHPAHVGSGLMEAASMYEPEPEMTDEERAEGFKRFAEWGKSLTPQQPLQPTLPVDSLGVPVSKLMQKIKAEKEAQHDDRPGTSDAGAEPVDEPDAGGDHGGQGEVPRASETVEPHSRATGLFAALEAGGRKVDEGGR